MEDYELHALGALEGPERVELEEHLRRGCPTCTQGIRRAITLNTFVWTLLPEAAPPKGLKERVMSSIGVPRSSWIGSGSIGSSRVWNTLWMGAFCVTLAALLYFGVEARQRTAELLEARRTIQKAETDLGQMQQALLLLNEPDTKQVIFGQDQPKPPRGRIFVSAAQGVLLLVGNLPPAPAGRTYELWVIPKGGAPKPAGLFSPDAAGNALYLSKGPVNVSDTGAIAVSVEPESGSTAPTTKPLIQAVIGG